MANNRNIIAILVSLYGNTPYLKEFLDSLSAQTLQKFRLLYRFDGTPTEDIRALLNAYDFAEQISDERFCGIPETYWELLLQTSAYPYVMFADQDDIWHPDKVEKSLAAIQKMESLYGTAMPLLVHSDLTVTDAQRKILADSFCRYQSLNPEYNSLKDLMIQNNVTGCTTIFNRALAHYMQKPVPAICHDWYMALIAAAFGKIGFIQESLVDYRQHSGNQLGAIPIKKMLPKCFSRPKLHKRIVLTQQQAQLFWEEYRTQLSSEQCTILETWGKILPESPYLKRFITAFRFRFRKNGWLRTLGMFWAL